ncbi:MAG TPA: hypothetical protein VJW20_16870 [Candidatus Angelobacter sp.]|nr:hypothetical protein [Candidatus Angelobacter sp.]
MMSKPEQVSVPTLAHRIVNKLSIIIGNCDLLIERIGNTEHAHRLEMIREVAKAAADELTQHEQELETKARRTQRRKAS